MDHYSNSMSNLTSALHKLDPHIQTSKAPDAADGTKSLSLDDFKTVLLSQGILDELEAATYLLPDKHGGLISLDSRAQANYNQILEQLLWFRRATNKLNPLQGYVIDSYGTSQADTPITVTLAPTLLEVSAPDSVYPGQTITVHCLIDSTDNDLLREVKLSLDDVILYQTPVQHQSSLQAVIPTKVSPGKHTLTVFVEPQDRFAGASATLPIDIFKIPIQVSVQIPKIAILPKSINIDGLISSDRIPLHDTQVEIHLDGNIGTARTTEDGSFSARLESAHDNFPSGLQRIEITAIPAEPWYSPLKVYSSVLIVGPVISGLILALLLLPGIILVYRARSPRRRIWGDSPTWPAKPEKSIVMSSVEHEKPVPADIGGRIISAYMTGLRVIETLTGIPMVYNNTLREFLDKATLRLTRAIPVFHQLTALAEVALYSSHDIDETTASKAEQLAHDIQLELANENI